VAKVKINGEYFDYDFDRQPLSEMLALEKALKTTYGQWSADRQAGSARALAGLIWLVWLRNGREVPFEDIESGAVELDLADFDIEDAGEQPDPTTSPAGKGASPTTGTSTSARSLKS
jgi:hypothetical protein